MKEIMKFCDANIFEKILSKEKTFEIRLGNLEINKGDTLILKEIDKNRKETGREIIKKVGFFLKTKNLPYWSEEDKNKYGFTIIQLEDK